MKISLVDPDIKGLSTVRLSHDNEESLWNTSTFDRTKFLNIHGFFDEINLVWSKMSQDDQSEIWNLYCEIHHVLNTISDLVKLQLSLRNLIAKLMTYHPLEKIKQIISFHGKLTMPESMKVEYGPLDPKETTYLRDDYYDLMILTVALRPVFPILCEFIERTKREVGSNYKEQHAMELLAHSYLYTCPPMERLRLYVENRISPNDVTLAAIQEGLGGDELPEWILQRAVVRKVMAGEVNTPNSQTNIITNVYNYIESNRNSMDRNFRGRVTDKRKPREGMDEDNISQIETYKVKQENPDGVEVFLSEYAQKTVAIVKAIDRDVRIKQVDKCMSHMTTLGMMRTQKHHITLTQWVLADAIPAKGILLMDKPTQLRLFAITQAILWHWGFDHLALLMSAEPLVLEDEEDSFNVIESRTRTTKGLFDRLVELYPYYQSTGSKSQNERQSNVAAKAIDSLARELYKFDWVVEGPEELRVKLLGEDETVLIIAPDLKNQLASLIIHLNERKRPEQVDYTDETNRYRSDITERNPNTAL